MASQEKAGGVVVLVDHKHRDLPVAALVAHLLGELGVACHLEPLESYQAVLAAYRPEMIVFNHLTANHLERYSKRLAEIGVLTAVLSNEGINYDDAALKFDSGKYHSGAHIDWFFCWNEPHRQALLELGFGEHTRIEVVGVPRFDLYFEPWSQAFFQPAPAPKERPRVLVCTNFSLAKFAELPREQGDKFFAAWKDRIPIYRDYWPAIEAHAAASRRIFDHLDALVQAGDFDVILRPHPREAIGRYEEWLARLPVEQRARVTLDATSAITPLILGCDLEISCETCTTALESWIAGKPTVELLFAQHPMLCHPEHSACSTHCAAPDQLVPLIRRILAHGEPPDLLAARRRHLAKWCHTSDGASCQRLAALIARAVKEKQPADWSRLNATDRRRGAKLKLLHMLGLAYHFDPLMPAKLRLNRGRYAIKCHAYEKSIKPADVREARALLQRAEAQRK